MKHSRNIALIALLAALPAVASTTADLIARLGSDDWPARQSAEDALVASGPAAIDDLKTALASTQDIELRERLTSAINRIGREQITGATLVTLDKTFDRPIDALRAVANVLGLSITVQSDKAAALIEAPHAVHLQYQSTPWIKAILDCAADAGVAVRISGEQIVVLDTPAVEGRPRLALAGAAAIVADTVRQNQSIDFTSGGTSAYTSLVVAMNTEPKLRIAGNVAVLKVNQVIDDQGRPLIDRSAKVGFAREPDGRWIAQMILLRPDPAPQRIARIDATLVASIVVASDDLRIGNLASLPMDMQTAAGPVGVKSVSQTNGQWSIAIHVPQSFANGGANGRVWQSGNADMLQITDSHGRRLAVGPAMPSEDGDLQLTMPITLAAPEDAPQAVLIRVPSRTREWRTPVVFTDLRLP